MIVAARSWALTPVVQPSNLSIVTVKGVFSSYDEVAFILTVLVIHYDDEFSIAEVL